ncbi:MAG: pantoate--beta-alanine ligase [Gammaproteobacteria bacterium]|nr:pantoate--beta-alanine ligase [Gammaproteobacteria bacterium]
MRQAAADCDYRGRQHLCQPAAVRACKEDPPPIPAPSPGRLRRRGSSRGDHHLLRRPTRRCTRPGSAPVEVDGLHRRPLAARPGPVTSRCHHRGDEAALPGAAPTRAYFGEKDHQQLQVIARTNEDLGLGCEIVGMPIVREPDGLAMSSRNQYLSPGRTSAATLPLPRWTRPRTVRRRGVTEAESLCAAARIVMARQPAVRIDYVELVDPATLQPLPVLDRPGRLCLAAFVGRARLIDNAALWPAESIAIAGDPES